MLYVCQAARWPFPIWDRKSKEVCPVSCRFLQQKQEERGIQAFCIDSSWKKQSFRFLEFKNKDSERKLICAGEFKLRERSTMCERNTALLIKTVLLRAVWFPWPVASAPKIWGEGPAICFHKLSGWFWCLQLKFEHPRLGAFMWI